jgi:hypothetical protein
MSENHYINDRYPINDTLYKLSMLYIENCKLSREKYDTKIGKCEECKSYIVCRNYRELYSTYLCIFCNNVCKSILE